MEDFEVPTSFQPQWSAEAEKSAQRSRFGYDLLNRLAVGVMGAGVGTLATAGALTNAERLVSSLPGNSYQWIGALAGAATLAYAVVGSLNRS